MTTASVQPDYALYRLTTEPTRRSSSAPAVLLAEVSAPTGEIVDRHLLTPGQARELAAGLTVAADIAEGKTDA